MSRATFFVQECPTCGRHLQIRVMYLGKPVVCPHCRGQFDAHDPETGELNAHDSGSNLLDRADELLASASANRRRSSAATVPSPPISSKPTIDAAMPLSIES